MSNCDSVSDVIHLKAILMDFTNQLRWPEIGMYLDHEQMRGRGARRMVSMMLE